MVPSCWSRILALTLSAGLLAACQPEGSNRPVTSSATAIPPPIVSGTSQPVAAGSLRPPFPGCLVTVDFPTAGQTGVRRPANLTPGADYYSAHADLSVHAAVGYECSCEPGFRPDLITEPMAVSLIQGRMIERQLTVGRMSFAPNGPLAKTLQATGTTPSPWGDLTMSFLIYYLPQCVVVTWSATSTQASEGAKAQAETFLRNARRADRRGAAPASSAAPTFSLAAER